MKTFRTAAGAALLAGLLMLSAAPAARAADFYVSSIHASRSDSNPGTSPTAPWATFEKVKASWGSVIKAGDTVHLGRGSTWYWSWGSSAPYWYISTGGTAGNPVTIRGDDYGTGGKPVLQRNGGTGWGSMIGIGGTASYVTLRDFTIDGGMNAGYASTAISIGGGYLKTTPVSNVKVLNMTIQNLGNTTAAYACGIEVAGYNNLAVNDCLIENNDVSSYTGHGLNHYPQKTTYRTTSANNRIVWRNNRCWGASPNVWAGCGAGIHIAFGGSDNVFEYNYVAGGNPAGSFMIMNCNNNETNLKIRRNVVKGNDRSNGMIFLYDGNGVAGTTVSCDISDNIFMQSKYAAISIEANNAFSGTINIYNNTFYDNRLAAAGTGQGGEILVAAANNGLNINLRNNLFYHKAYSGNSTPSLCVISGYSATLTHQNNLYWHTGGTGSPAVYDRGTTYSVANVKNYEGTAQNADPLFADTAQLPTSVSSVTGPAPSGLALRSGSPAINAGVALAAEFATDISNVTRPQGTAWDIGSYEFLSGPIQVGAPSAPSQLTATATASNQVALAWQDNAANETQFKIERSPDGAAFTQIATVASNVLLYVNTGLAARTTYSYRVRASNSGGDSAYSAVASALTPGPTVPAAPSGLAATAGTSGQVVLSWTDNSANETGFVLERGSTSTNFTQFAAVGVNVTTMADATVSAGNTYYYRVRASNEAGNSPFSNVATFQAAGVREARQYYVSSVAAGRSDANAGTNPAAPWATIDKVKAEWGTSIRAGDTVHLGAGSVWTWSGDTAWTLTQGGSSTSSPIVVRGDDYGTGASPILRKAGGTTVLGAITISGSASYLTLRNFTLEGGADRGFHTTGIRIGGPDQSGPIHHVTISGMQLRNLGNGTNVMASGIELMSRNGFSVSDCLIESNAVSGFSAFGLSHFPEKNVARSISAINRTVYRGNRILDPSPNRFSLSNAGFKIRSGGVSNVVEYNTIIGPFMEGLISLINCGNDESNLTVRFNVLRDNTEGTGIWIGYDGSGATGILYKADLVGNIVAGCLKPGLTLETRSLYRGSFNVFNNTFYGNEQRIGAADLGGDVALLTLNAGSTVTLANNILSHLAIPGSQTPCLTVQVGFLGSFAHHHNLYWNAGGDTAPIVYNMGTIHTAGTAAAYEGTAVAGNPDFLDTNQPPASVSAEGGVDPNGLAILPTSPALNRGADLGPAYARGIEGLPRPQGTGWDIGAYESVVPPGPPTNLHVVP